MLVKRILKSNGLAALAVGIMTAALPSAAFADPQDGQGHWDRGGGEHHGRGDGNNGNSGGNGGGEHRGGDSGMRGHWNGGGAVSQTAPVQVQPVQQAQARPSWNGGQRDGNGQGRGTWQGNNAATGTVQSSNWRSNDRPSGGDWRDRNDGARSDQRHNDQWRNESRARQGNAWRGNDRWRSGDNRNWNRDWRHDNRYDWRDWRNSHRDVYRLSRYYPPYRNWSYRRLGVGFFLDSLFFSSNYWIDNPWMYRLPEADGPYRWVRYYDDALLVDVYSGEVVDVIYDFFW